ncbi:unnamed protein product, partial [Durusdinium trenchii]
KSEDHSLRDALFNEDTEKQMPQLFSKIQDEALSGLALDERQVADLSKALGIMARSGGKVRPGLTWGGETDSGVSECH